jgi:hypothetical protein
MEAVVRGNTRTTAILLAGLMATILLVPFVSVSASLTTAQSDVYLSCVEDDECLLTPTPIGEEVLSDTVFASPAQPRSLTFEFDMDPEQNQLALLPSVLTSMEIDFRFSGDATGAARPELDISLILGQSVTDWEFDAQPIPGQSVNEPYILEDEPLNLNGNRVLWPEDVVRLRLTFVLDRPGTWELHMRGNSFFQIDIEWSEDIESRNSDEPSSDLEPQSTEFETSHKGALVENDRDCWAFEVEQHEVLSVFVIWEAVPIEIEQPHQLPNLFMPNGREAPAPEVIVSEDGTETRITYRWRALPLGDYTLCLGGVAEKFQPYTWTGQLAYEGLGPLDPSGFSGTSFYPVGAASLGDENGAVQLETTTYGFLILCLFVLILFCVDGLRHSTSTSLRFGLFAPGVVLMLLGGVFHPLWAGADEVQLDEEYSLDELVEYRLQQLWDVSYPGVPEQVLVKQTGATWGMLDGERLQLRLEVDEVRPMEDGRWQLVVPELEDLRLDEAIFGQVARGGVQTTDQGLLEDQTVRFILLAGRSLLLDLLMLEGLLVVDERPTSTVFHLDVEMVTAPATGSVSVPAWGTRPSTISNNDWVLLQSSLFPDQISVTLCDCDLDLLDVRFTPSDGFDARDVPKGLGLRNASGLIPMATPFAMLGFVFLSLSARIEYTRRKKARDLAQSMFESSEKWS